MGNLHEDIQEVDSSEITKIRLMCLDWLIWWNICRLTCEGGIISFVENLWNKDQIVGIYGGKFLSSYGCQCSPVPKPLGFLFLSKTILNMLSTFIPHETSTVDDKYPLWFTKKKKFIQEKSNIDNSYRNSKTIITYTTCEDWNFSKKIHI